MTPQITCTNCLHTWLVLQITYLQMKFKYGWKGADDDLDAIIEYVDEKGGDECGDYASDENMYGDSDDGGGKQKSHGGM